MQRLREESCSKHKIRSIWGACDKRKVFAVLLLAGWVETNSATCASMPNIDLPAGTYDISLSSVEDLARSVMNRSQRAAAYRSLAEVSPFQLGTLNRSVQLPELKTERAQKCLALNIYWEARNQSIAGQLAVAQVTLNRVRDPRYSDSVCEVVYEHKQFSWYWDGKSDVPRESKAWLKANLIASAALDGSGHVELQGVTHYHAAYSQPYWKDYMVKVTKIDDHIFYVE